MLKNILYLTFAATLWSSSVYSQVYIHLNENDCTLCNQGGVLALENFNKRETDAVILFGSNDGNSSAFHNYYTKNFNTIIDDSLFNAIKPPQNRSSISIKINSNYRSFLLKGMDNFNELAIPINTDGFSVSKHARIISFDYNLAIVSDLELKLFIVDLETDSSKIVSTEKLLSIRDQLLDRIPNLTNEDKKQTLEFVSKYVGEKNVLEIGSVSKTPNGYRVSLAIRHYMSTPVGRGIGASSFVIDVNRDFDLENHWIFPQKNGDLVDGNKEESVYLARSKFLGPTFLTQLTGFGKEAKVFTSYQLINNSWSKLDGVVFHPEELEAKDSVNLLPIFHHRDVFASSGEKYGFLGASNQLFNLETGKSQPLHKTSEVVWWAGIQDKNLFTTEVLDEHSILKRNGKIVYHFEGYIKPFKLDSGHLYFTKLNDTSYTVYILIL